MDNNHQDSNTLSSNKNTQNSNSNTNTPKSSKLDSGSESDTDVRVFSIVQNACLGAFISGYTGSELSLQYQYIVQEIDIDPSNELYEKAFTAVFVLGGLMGAIIYSQLQKQATKKNIMILADLILISSVIFQLDGWQSFGLQRFLKGIANGINLCAVLVYIREVSGEKRADASIGLFQINVNVGIVMATVISLRLPFYAKVNETTYWKFLLCFPALPALLRAYVLIFWYDFDTPFSLLQRKKTDAASKVLFMLGQLGYEEKRQEKNNSGYEGQELMNQQQQREYNEDEKEEEKSQGEYKNEVITQCTPQQDEYYSTGIQVHLLPGDQKEENHNQNEIDSNIIKGETEDDGGITGAGSFIFMTGSINQQIEQQQQFQAPLTEIDEQPKIPISHPEVVINYFFADSQLRLTEAQESLQDYTESISASFHRRWIYGAIAFGIQQLSGINSITSWVNKSVQSSDSTDSDNQNSSESDNVILFLNILLLLIAVGVYFNINRLYATSKFIIGGCILAGVTLIPLSFLSRIAQHSGAGYGKTVCVALYLLAFNSSLGPLTIVYVTKICKDVSISRALIVYWTCYFISQFIQQYSDDDSSVPPLIYAFSCFVGAYFFYKYSMIEQTQRKSYLEIDKIFAQQNNHKQTEKKEERQQGNVMLDSENKHKQQIESLEGISEYENENEDA